MSPEDRLALFLGETPAPQASGVFVAEVMEAVERRILLDRLALGGSAALAASVVLWACAPILNLAVDTLAPSLAPAAGMLLLALAALVVGDRLLASR